MCRDTSGADLVNYLLKALHVNIAVLTSSIHVFFTFSSSTTL
jgi:hypothetical protein